MRRTTKPGATFGSQELDLANAEAALVSLLCSGLQAKTRDGCPAQSGLRGITRLVDPKIQTKRVRKTGIRPAVAEGSANHSYAPE